jgi:hypothetical protein
MAWDKIDSQINTYPRALWTLVRASRWTALAGLLASVNAFYELAHSGTVSVFLILGPMLLIYYGAIAWRTSAVLKLQITSGAKNG